ncbi:PTS transporter subunit EIIC [Spiroplasma floricola]|uniref:PTS system, cellobiose-specific IIC component n=1 Tax=Spiroplasma floricola 23-6 TaxID=1336749 RepID=A0A2K8SEP3_9MOLU|nr:PTS transporter subunit EIIC [Spiroplasma floricola]AUB31310.1 PTS system, cellobiose-specific IIC component [Spiroplasma floricola 23-6]
MLKYEKYPDIFDASNSIKSSKQRIKKVKKEIFELKNELHLKKIKHKEISSTFNKIRKEKEKELSANFNIDLLNAKYKKADINKIYDDYNSNIANLKEEYAQKKELRLQKSENSIQEVKGKIKSLKIELDEIVKQNKESKIQIKINWNNKREQIKEEDLKLRLELQEIKKQFKIEKQQLKAEYFKQYNILIEQWKNENKTTENVHYLLSKLGHKKKLKPLKTEIDQTVYELSLKINDLKVNYENKVSQEKSKINNQKLLIRYNAGKADLITIKTSIDKITWASGKLSNWKFMVAIKNGFFSLMPLVIVGAVFILINNIILGAGNGGLFNLFYLTADQLAILEKFKTIGSYIWNGTYAFFGFLLAGAIAYHLAPYYKVNQWAAAIMAFVSFLIMNPSFWTNLAVFGNTGMFTAMLIGIFSTILFGQLSKNQKLKIKMPDSVPDGVAKSFNILIPYAITAIVFGITAFSITWIGQSVGEINIGKNKVTFIDINGLITVAIQKPLVNAVSGFGGMISIVFLWQVLWFMGIHASGILSPIVEPIQLDGLIQNQQALADGTNPQYVFTNPFMNNFLFMGGTGGTIGLIIAIFIFSKRGDYRTMAKVTLIPAIFCINEPLLFGLPIVLNPIFAVPFIFGPLLAGIFAYLATTLGMMPHSSVIVPWTTPPVIGGILTTKSLMGGLVALINLGILITMYSPFVMLANKIEQRELLNKFAQNKNISDENIVKLNSNLKTSPI